MQRTEVDGSWSDHRQNYIRLKGQVSRKSPSVMPMLKQMIDYTTRFHTHRPLEEANEGSRVEEGAEKSVGHQRSLNPMSSNIEHLDLSLTLPIKVTTRAELLFQYGKSIVRGRSVILTLHSDTSQRYVRLAFVHFQRRC